MTGQLCAESAANVGLLRVLRFTDKSESSRLRGSGVENLWVKEMVQAEAALEGVSPDERLRIMGDAIYYAVFLSPSPLASSVSTDVARLVRSAVDVTRESDRSMVRHSDLVNEMTRLVHDQPPVASIVLSAAIDLVASIAEEPTESEATDVLFSCYDATMQSQGFGRVITLEDQASNAACLDVIRNQKRLLGIDREG